MTNAQWTTRESITGKKPAALLLSVPAANMHLRKTERLAVSGEEAVIQGMHRSLFHHLLSEALAFMHTLSIWSQIAHWYSEVLISFWKCDGKGFRQQLLSFFFFFKSFCWLRRSHYPVPSWWIREGEEGCHMCTFMHTHTQHAPRVEKRGLGRLQQYQHHLISVNTGALCRDWSHVSSMCACAWTSLVQHLVTQHCAWR